MKRSLNFRGKAGSHLTTANLADLMRRYVPESKREAEVPVQVGALLEFPLHRLRVVATEFVRDAAFPDAVAQVIVESGTGDLLGHGTHLVTPWGPVQVISRPAPTAVQVE